MSYGPSGEGDATKISKGDLKKHSKISKIGDVSPERLSGYVSFVGYGEADPQTTPYPQVPSVKQRPKPVINPARRDAIRRNIAKAKSLAETMEMCAGVGDLMGLSIAGFDLKYVLQDLWELRDEREDEWGDLLNLLQGALAQEIFERFSTEQCYIILTIIADHLGAGAVDVDDLEDSIRLLRKAGFDPWKGISGTVESNAE
jgi:hypothetical protein